MIKAATNHFSKPERCHRSQCAQLNISGAESFASEITALPNVSYSNSRKTRNKFSLPQQSGPARFSNDF